MPPVQTILQMAHGYIHVLKNNNGFMIAVLFVSWSHDISLHVPSERIRYRVVQLGWFPCPPFFLGAENWLGGPWRQHFVGYALTVLGTESRGLWLGVAHRHSSRIRFPLTLVALALWVDQIRSQTSVVTIPWARLRLGWRLGVGKDGWVVSSTPLCPTIPGSTQSIFAPRPTRCGFDLVGGCVRSFVGHLRQMWRRRARTEIRPFGISSMYHGVYSVFCAMVSSTIFFVCQ